MREKATSLETGARQRALSWDLREDPQATRVELAAPQQDQSQSQTEKEDCSAEGAVGEVGGTFLGLEKTQNCEYTLYQIHYVWVLED